jgi:hypothetical protein
VAERVQVVLDADDDYFPPEQADIILYDSASGKFLPRKFVEVLAEMGLTDAFGRQRVSDPQVLFEGKCIIDEQPLLYDDAETSGSGTGTSHSANTASVTLSVGATTAGTRVRQSKRRLAYQPGKSQLSFITFTMGAAATGITRRVGLFDESNGIFLEQTSSGLSWVRRTYASGSPVDNATAQASWSEDVMDGTGASGYTLDMTKSQIITIDYEWLGVGIVRVGFVIDGAIVYTHYFKHSNVLAGVYTSTPNYPVRFEIANDATGAASNLETICASVMSEGGAERTGIIRAVDRGVTGLTTGADTNIYPLCAIRLGSGGLEATVRALKTEVFCSSTSDWRWALILNPTVAGTAFSFSALADSPVEYDVARTNATTLSGGYVLASGYGSASVQSSPPQASPTDYALGSLIDGTSDILVLAVQNISGAAETYFGSLTFLEQV